VALGGATRMEGKEGGISLQIIAKCNQVHTRLHENIIKQP